MSKYSTKILPEDNGYIGYLLLNNEVVSTTKKFATAVQASLALESLSKTPPTESINRNYNPNPSPFVGTRPVASNPSAPKCCGRG